ncbi:MAG: hypothetical protein QW667_06655 [Candidatus Bathyarchaeia archaeon]
MSQPIRLSLSEVKEWLEKETGQTFVPVQTRAQRLIEDMRRNLENLYENSKTLLESSGKEIEKRNMKTYGRARALNKLAKIFMDRFRQIKVPEKITYDSFAEFVQESQKAFLVTEVDIKNWFPRISPFFILDRRKFLTTFEKSKETLKEMQNFLTKEYVKTKKLEETFQLIDEIRNLEGQLSNVIGQRQKVEHEKALAEKEIDGIRQKIIELESRGGIGQLSQIDREIEALNTEVKQAFQHLQKPFIKMQSLALHGEGSGLTPEEINKLNQYLDNSFQALATEEKGYPILRHLLQKLARLMVEEKLKLKPEKIRKAEQAINNIVNKNSLESLHEKCAEVLMRKRQLSTSAEIAETKSLLLKLQEQLKEIERKRERIEFEKAALERAYEDLAGKIQQNKVNVERNIMGFLGKAVQIE